MITLNRLLVLSLGLALAIHSASASSLKQMTIRELGAKAQVDTDKIQVMFNPKEYTITKSTPWKHHDIQGLDAPTLEFTSGEPYRCNLLLFFDGYEEGKSVREVTDKIEKLAKLSQERPVSLNVEWGGQWQNHLLAAKTEFVDFMPDGTPVAAIVHTTWSTFLSGEPDRGLTLEPVKAILSTPKRKFETYLSANTARHLRLQSKQVLARDIHVTSDRGLTPPVLFAEGDPERFILDMQFQVGTRGEGLKELISELETLAEPKQRAAASLAWGNGFRFSGLLESFSIRTSSPGKETGFATVLIYTAWKEFAPASEQLKGNPRH